MADEAQQAKAIRETITTTRLRLQCSKRTIRRIQQALDTGAGTGEDDHERES